MAIQPPPTCQVPGSVIAHSPAASGRYIGSPALALLPDGTYLVSHDEFGPRSSEHSCAISHIYQSLDGGQHWERIASVPGAFWSSLFWHRGAVYLLGMDRHHGRLVIHRSTDRGFHWTQQNLSQHGEFHSAPVPIIEHGGRLWRALEWRDPPQGWGLHYRAGVLSAPADADLLDPACWRLSNFLPLQSCPKHPEIVAWLEGNVVVDPEDRLVVLLRLQGLPGVAHREKVARLNVSADGSRVEFDSNRGVFPFPGGAKKFTIRWDGLSGRYWALANISPEAWRNEDPFRVRNTLALTSSPDLRNWRVHTLVLSHPDVKHHGYQYADWHFEGEDLIVVCRTAHDDEWGGAQNFHDSNFLTFHRIRGFRRQ